MSSPMMLNTMRGSAIARPTATAPAPSASTRPSVSSCRTMRGLLAPIESRVAISRLRASARASCRLPTFAQASTSTSATAPPNAPIRLSVPRPGPDADAVPNSWIRPAGFCRDAANRSCSRCNSWPAWRLFTPGASRPTIAIQHRAEPADGSHVMPSLGRTVENAESGIQMSTSRPLPSNSGSSTPTMVKGLPET